MKKIIDAKGVNCPMPVIMAKKEIDSGEKFFQVEVDNKIAVENLKRLAGSQGFSVTVEEAGADFKVNFANGCEECEEVLEKVMIKEEPKHKLGLWSIFVGKEIIGSGSEELGKSLMKMYFYTISESSELPKSILFMNDGVKLPTLNEQVIEHLKDLEAKGVEILVCGACLNFYGLEESVKVGTISNMYAITQAMQESYKVVTV